MSVFPQDLSLLIGSLFPNAKIHGVELLSGGFVADTYLVTLETKEGEHRVVCKQATDRYLAQEKMGDKLVGFLEGESVVQTTRLSPAVLGCFRIRGESVERVTPFQSSEALWQVQAYAPGSMWLSTLIARSDAKEVIDEVERDELRCIVEAILVVHRTPTGISDVVLRGRLYRRGLRDVLTHPEMTMAFLQQYVRDHPVLTEARQRELIGLMWEAIRAFDGRSERLCWVHGDFWGANVLLAEDGQVSLIDVSRFGMSDPGIDVGEMYGALVWEGVSRGRRYFLTLAEAFLEEYIRQSDDEGVRETGILYLGFTMSTCLTLAPEVPLERQQAYAAFVTRCLIQRRLCSPDEFV